MKRVVFLMSAMLLVATSANASPWENQPTYTEKAVHKLGFGAKNLLLGWTELFTEPARADNGTEFIEGIGRGLLNTVVYTVGGAVHVVTFPFTGIDVPLPGDGVDF